MKGYELPKSGGGQKAMVSILLGCQDFNFSPTNGLATETSWCPFRTFGPLLLPGCRVAAHSAEAASLQGRPPGAWDNWFLRFVLEFPGKSRGDLVCKDMASFLRFANKVFRDLQTRMHRSLQRLPCALMSCALPASHESQSKPRQMKVSTVRPLCFSLHRFGQTVFLLVLSRKCPRVLGMNLGIPSKESIGDGFIGLIPLFPAENQQVCF